MCRYILTFFQLLYPLSPNVLRLCKDVQRPLIVNDLQQKWKKKIPNTCFCQRCLLFEDIGWFSIPRVTSSENIYDTRIYCVTKGDSVIIFTVVQDRNSQTLLVLAVFFFAKCQTDTFSCYLATRQGSMKKFAKADTCTVTENPQFIWVWEMVSLLNNGLSHY